MVTEAPFVRAKYQAEAVQLPPGRMNQVRFKAQRNKTWELKGGGHLRGLHTYTKQYPKKKSGKKTLYTDLLLYE